MSDRTTRYGGKQQPAAPGAASGSSAQKQSSARGKTKETTAADAGNSDIASNDSAAKPSTPTPNPITFSAEPERYIGVAIGEAIGGVEERLETRLQNQANMLDYSMAELRGLLQNLNVRNNPIENGSSQAAGAGNHQNPPFLPIKQHPLVHAETAEQGSFTKQERSSSFPPNLQIPNPQHRDDYQHQQQRSPSPYHRSNTLAPEFGGTTVRWRPEDLGYFHGQKDDVHTWVDRIRELVALKGSPVVQANLSLLLRDEAENWYHHELTKEQKWALLDPGYGIEPWISALTHRFKMDLVEILAKLNKQRYTRLDAASGKDPIEHLHAVMKLTRNRSTAESLYEAYMRIDSVWQLSLVAPTSTTTIEDFVKQLNAKKAAWYSEAKRMEPKDRSYGNGSKLWQSGDARNVGNSNGNGRWQNQRNERQNYQNDRSRDHFRQPPPNPGDVGPRVHHAAPLVSLMPPPRGAEDEEESDPDVWHTDSGYGHGCSEPHCQHWHSS